MFNRRLEDLTVVFDKRWKANHNNDVKIIREKEKKFMDKMFNVNNSVNNTKPLTPGERASNLQSNMDNFFNGQRQSNLNNIIKKWK